MDGFFKIISSVDTRGVTRFYVALRKHRKPGLMDKKTAANETILSTDIVTLDEFESVIKELQNDLEKLLIEARKKLK
jgi:predicted AlkP superfamily phosphohydrolase/phosphomutase